MASANHTAAPEFYQGDTSDHSERWLGLAFAPGYEISDLGRLITYLTRRKGVLGPPRFKRLQKDRGGYLRARIVTSFGERKFLIHHLVLMAFVGPRQQGMVCRHLDGNRANNRLDNLKWGTPSENQHDSIRHGTHSTFFAPGERHPLRKLGLSDVEEIRRLCAAGRSRKSLGKQFGVTTTTITMIVEEVTWKVSRLDPAPARAPLKGQMSFLEEVNP